MGNTIVGPEIAPGTVSIELTLMDCDELNPQALPVITEIDPLAKQPKLTFMAGEPCPLRIVAPVGTDHVYKVAYVTGVTEKLTVNPARSVVGPEMFPAVAGIPVYTVRDVEPAADTHPLADIRRLYIPSLAAVTLLKVAFWVFEV